MNRTEPAGQADPAQAFRSNRIAAIGMTFVTAATLLVLRPELSLVYIVYVAMSVFGLSLARAYGLFVQPRPVMVQNFAAYVSVSTIGFLITLFAAPHMIELLGSTIFFVIAAVMAILFLHAIIGRK